MTTITRPPTALTSEQQAAFRDQGFVIIPGLFDDTEIQACHDIHTAATYAGRAELALGAKMHRGLWESDSSPDGQPVLRKVDNPFGHYAAFRTIFTRRKVLDRVRDLIGSPDTDDLYYHSSKMMCKPPHVGRRKPWHQDYAYWPEMDAQQLTLWVAIDPATRENGCIQVIPGSHKEGLIKHEHIEDWQIREDGIDDSRIQYAVMNPGDALFFDVMTLHASDPNRSDRQRLSAIIDYSARAGFNGNGALGSDQPLSASD